MGMFNSVNCSYPLPIDPPLRNNIFQTKDEHLGELFLDTYHVEADGSVLRQPFGRDRKNIREPVLFDGVLNIYTFEPLAEHPRGYTTAADPHRWVELNLTFENSRVAAVELVEDSTTK